MKNDHGLLYIPNFYQRADELYEFIKTLPVVRPRNARQNGKYAIRRLSFPGYCPSWDDYKDNDGFTAADAPEPFLKLAAALTKLRGGRLQNYFSSIGYLAGPDGSGDGMTFHQHVEDDKPGHDQTVCVVTLGACQPVMLRFGETRDVMNQETGRVKQKFVPDGRTQTIHPTHGSVYVLGHDLNRRGSGYEAEHGVLRGNDQSYGGLRISTNTKSIPPGLSREEFDLVCSRPAGRTNAHDAGLTIPEPGEPRTFDCHAGKKWPEGSVYVGRETTRGGANWPSTPYGNHKKLHGQDWIDETNRLMSDPEFAAKMREDLRGKHLLCWCEPGNPRCHALRWLELANK